MSYTRSFPHKGGLWYSSETICDGPGPVLDGPLRVRFPGSPQEELQRAFLQQGLERLTWVWTVFNCGFN